MLLSLPRRHHSGHGAVSVSTHMSAASPRWLSRVPRSIVVRHGCHRACLLLCVRRPACQSIRTAVGSCEHSNGGGGARLAETRGGRQRHGLRRRQRMWRTHPVQHSKDHTHALRRCFDFDATLFTQERQAMSFKAVLAPPNAHTWLHAQEWLNVTPLQKAAAFNPHAEVIRLLLDAGADMRAKACAPRLCCSLRPESQCAMSACACASCVSSAWI